MSSVHKSLLPSGFVVKHPMPCLYDLVPVTTEEPGVAVSILRGQRFKYTGSAGGHPNTGWLLKGSPAPKVTRLFQTVPSRIVLWTVTGARVIRDNGRWLVNNSVWLDDPVTLFDLEQAGGHIPRTSRYDRRKEWVG
jgi:hypothetical protein